MGQPLRVNRSICAAVGFASLGEQRSDSSFGGVIAEQWPQCSISVLSCGQSFVDGLG